MLTEEYFQTERLSYRRPLAIDQKRVFAIYSDLRTSALSPTHAFTSMAEASELIESWNVHWMQHGFGTRAIATRLAPDEVVGFGGVSYRNFDGVSLPNLWYRLAPEAWGKSYATEFAAACIQHIRETSSLQEIHALVFSSNLASVRILDKLGMRLDGKLQNGNQGQASLRYRLDLMS